MNRTRIKICGIKRDEDVAFLNEAAPDYAGFVFVPGTPRYVTLAQAVHLRAGLNSDIKTAGVFRNNSIEEVIDVVESGAISIVQLHGGEDSEYIRVLREKLGNVEIWKAYVMKTEEDAQKAQSSSADRILLDSGAGTGRTFDWNLMDAIGKKEFILAGGLNADNIEEAIDKFRPFAVDLSSGVEEGGVKNRQKILDVVGAVRKGK